MAYTDGVLWVVFERCAPKQREEMAYVVTIVNGVRTQNGHIRNDTRDVLGPGTSETDRSRHI
jgi:hypothetical protein